MKSKKLLSVIVVLAMILQMLPVFASETAGDTTISSINYFVNDQFNTDGDTQGWAKGAVKSGTAAFTVTQGTAPDGSGALILHTEGGDNSAAGKQPNAYKAFADKIDFEGKTVVIKTRFMQTGDGAETPDGRSFLKFNQPNNVAFSTVDDMKWNWTNTWGRTDEFPSSLSGSASGYNTLCGWFELLEFNTSRLEYMAKNNQKNWAYSTYSEGSTLNKWIEAEITINGSEDITISATIDGVKGEEVSGTLNQGFTGPQAAYTLYNDKTATEWITKFTTLDSLTWETATKNDIYIDYIQIYEPANVNIEVKETIKEDGVFTFEFINSNDTVINSLPEGAVTVEGVETTASYDASSQTLTLTPATALTGGTIYTAVVDTAKLEEVGIIYEGETTFDINVEIKLPDGFYLDDQFNTSGDTQGWAKGKVKSGTQTFNVEQGTAPDGSGALIFTSEGDKGIADGGNEPNIFKELTDKIPLNEGKKIVIKTRFMQEGNDAAVPTAGISYLRFNQPNNENLLSNNNIPYSYPNMTTKINNANAICDWFTLLKMEKGALSYRTQNGGAWAPTSFATVETLGKWIDATITINSNTSVEVSATIDGATYSKTDGSLIYSGTGPLVSYTLYNDPTATEALTEYPSLDSLTWVSQTKNTVYVDYVQIFEPTYVTVTAKETIKEDGVFTFEFANADDASKVINNIPADAVTVEGVETTASYDASTQTLTLTPATTLTGGESYKAIVNTEKLKTVGIYYNGEATFNINVESELPEGFYLDDQFNTSGDTQGWVKGAVKSGTAAFTVTQGTAPDGSGALILHTEGGSAGDGGYQPNAYKAFAEKVNFEDKTVVIKTRFMQAGSGEETPAGRSFLKFNQPNNVAFSTTSDITWNWTNTWDRTDAAPSLSGINTLCGWFELLEFNTSRLEYMAKNNQKNWAYSTYSEGSTLNKWIEAEITINGSEDITISATIDGVKGDVVNGTLNQGFTGPQAAYTLYNDKTATEWITEFTTLDSLTWETTTKNDIYVDYIQIYELPVIYAEAKKAIKEDGAFTFKFISKNNVSISNVPSGAVAIDGVETEASFDAETQTLTLTPVTTITGGQSYKAIIDTAKFKEAGIIYDGTAEFDIAVEVVLPEGVYLNDQFNTVGDTQGWVKGAVKSGTAAFTVTQGTAPDGSGALILHTEGGSSGNPGQQPNAYKEFAEKIDFEGKNVVIKTRFMQTGDGAETAKGTGYLKFNQPNDNAFSSVDDIKWNWTNTWNRTDAAPSLSGANKLCGWFNLLKFSEEQLGYMAKGDQKNWTNSVYSAENTLNKWIEAQIIINGSEDITILATIDGEEGDVANGTLNQGFTGPQAAYTLYNDKAATEWVSTFTTLDSLTWEATTKNDIYIDYIVIEDCESTPAKAQFLNGKRIETNDSFRLQFMSEKQFEEFPENIVTVSGAEVTPSFDAETQTLTLTPADALTAGEEYTVSINTAKLAAKGITYEGTKEFTVEAIAPRTTTLGTIVNTTFDDETSGGWIQGVANEGFKATLTPYTDGEDKVLKVVMPKSADDTNGGNQAIAHFELPEGIKYEEGKVVVIKTRVKNVTNTPYMIHINRRDTLSQPAHIRQHNCYALAGQILDGTNQLAFGTNSLHTYPNGNQWRAILPFNFDANKEAFSFADVDLANKWVEWEIVLDGNTNKMNVKATVEGLENALTTWSTENPVSALNTAQVLNYEFGKGTDIKTFNGLDSISFVNNSASDEGILYVDYVTVENKKDTAKVTSALTVNGNVVDKFNVGDTVVPQFTVNPVVSDKYTAISVMYVDGVIDTMYVEEIESENTLTTTITSENSFTVPAKGNVVIKTFVWDKFETMKPLGSAVTATVNDSIEVYVASNGDDINGTGDITSPVATIQKAVDVAGDKVSAISGFDGRVTIKLADGTYSPVTVSKTDIKVPAGGLVITNAEGAKPVISGGVDFNIAQATKVEDVAILNRISSQDAKNNLYVLDLTGVNVPAESWPGVKAFGVETLAEAADGIDIPEDRYLISFNGQLMTNARWPNTGYETALTVGGNTDSATSENVKNGFTIGCSNTNDWTNAKDALIFGFLGNGWATQTTPLAGKSGSTITSAYASKYGASATHARYYVYNLLEEIDTPYEYYIDRSVTPNKMYFYKPSDITEGTITFAAQKEVLLTLSSTSNVTVDGLTFENTIGRAVSVSQGSNNTIKNCEIRNVFADIDSTTDNAVLDVFSKNTVVENNYIHNTNGGIKVGSDTPETDIKTLASANNIIRNNHIENYGLSDKTYVDAIYCMGIGNQILNNEIHNAEHLAMRISGNNHTVQYNEIYDVCKETEDVGAIYMGHTWTSRGNKIVNNYFHDINTTVNTSAVGVNPIAAIFLDDHFAGAYIEGNIFANIGGDGVRSNRGREGYINNNLFVNCTRYGVALWSADKADTATTAGDYSGWLDSVKNIQENVKDGTYDATVWTKAFPELINTADEDWVKPEKFTVTNNIAVNSAKCLNVGDWITSLATKIEANETTANDPGFADMENGDYTIDLSLLKAIVPQFKDVQFVNMGRN